MPARTTISLPTRVPDIRKGDTVVVLTGKDAGKRGTVERVMRRRGTTYGRHKLPRPDAPRSRRPTWSWSTAQHRQAPHEAAPVEHRQHDRRRSADAAGRHPRHRRSRCRSAKVMLVCPRCDQPDACPAHAPWRSGQRVRVCRHCGEPLEVASVNRLHERYQNEVSPALSEAVQLRQPDAGAAAREDRRQHRPRRGAHQRQGDRRGGRRPATITGQKPIVTTRQAVDRPVPRSGPATRSAPR